MFLYKNFFFQYLLLFQSQSCLWESMAAIFRQSAGYVLFTKKARKLKFAESNQPKASLTKLWLANDKASRSLVV